MMNLFENLQILKENELTKFSYTGPIYRFDTIFGQIKKPIYTMAKTPGKAYTNFLAQIKQGNGLDYNANLSIDKNNIKVVDDIPDEAFDDSIDNISKPAVNDPKYNFEDPDREDDYVVESIMDFTDWLDINFDDLVKRYADEYEMSEYDVNSEDEDFEEYVNDKYEEYYRNTNRYLEDFDVEDTEQEYTSANTSINASKLPAIFKLVNLPSGSMNLDFGGGCYNNASEYLATKDVTNLIYDPYNRSSEHNKNVLDTIRKNNGADTATCSNVLNVIKEETARHTVIQNIYNLLKSNGVAYFTVYEGTGKGNEGSTKSGYQLNRKTVDYIDEIKEVFPDVNRKGKLIIAKK